MQTYFQPTRCTTFSRPQQISISQANSGQTLEPLSLLQVSLQYVQKMSSNWTSWGEESAVEQEMQNREHIVMGGEQDGGKRDVSVKQINRLTHLESFTTKFVRRFLIGMPVSKVQKNISCTTLFVYLQENHKITTPILSLHLIV